MVWPPDEMLMALADGEITSRAVEKELSAWLAHDSEARRLLVAYRQTMVLLTAAFARPTWEALAPAHLAVIDRYAPAADRCRPHWTGALPRFLSRVCVPVIAIAAVALVLSAGAAPDPRAGVASAILSATDKGRSPLEAMHGTKVDAERTQASDDPRARRCLQQSVPTRGRDLPRDIALFACRTGSGEWSITAHALVPPGASAREDDAGPAIANFAHVLGGISDRVSLPPHSLPVRPN